ncbi:MAG: ABC transporter permease [Flavobacterium sp.]|nr:MAG: ABC transporter permease [Flavobacterium sp.]
MLTFHHITKLTTNMASLQDQWEWEISSKNTAVVDSKEFWSYRYLLSYLVKRDTLLINQQTILGPFWLVLQPLLTLIVYYFVFSKLIGISTNTIPPILFYYSGIILWNLFSDCFIGTASTFRDHNHIFSKVYIPKLIIPISIVLTHVFRFLIQFLLLALLCIFYILFEDYHVLKGWHVLLFPLAVLLVAISGLGLGLMCSTLAAKYKDLFHLIGILIRLQMFLTPVFYPVNSLNKDVHWLIHLNPLTSFFELFRYAVFGEVQTTFHLILINSLLILTFLLLAVRRFLVQGNKFLDII